MANQSILEQFLSGFNTGAIDPIRQQGQNLGEDIADYQLQDTQQAQMGPRGNLWQPGMAPHYQAPPPPTPASYDLSGDPSYDYIEGRIRAAEAAPPPPQAQGGTDQGIFGPIQQPTPLPGSPPTTQVPPPGQPKHNEYEAMVKQYLQRLQEPTDIPQRKPLTGIQALAVLMNPQQKDTLLQMFDRGYQADLQKYQLEHGREAQAASLADRLAERQAQQDRQDAERAWFRESAMANSGAQVPAGYQWKNPELKAVHDQKQHEKSQADLRTKEYLDRGTRTKTQDRDKYIEELFSERARLRTLLSNPAAQQYMTQRSVGMIDPTLESVYGPAVQELQQNENEEKVIRAMDKSMFLDYVNRDGATQQKIIREFLAEMQKRQGMPGATTTSALPGTP